MSELPKFRRIEDVQRLLDDMYQEIDTTEKLVKQQQQLLSKLTAPTAKLKAMLTAAQVFDVTPDPSKSSILRNMKKVVDPALTKVVIPNLAKLKDQYGLMEDLYQKHSTLDSIATQIAMQFPDRRGPAYDKAVGSINELKSKVEKQLREVFEFLNMVASKHVPKEFKEYVAAVQAKISDHVSFEDSASYLYVSIKDGEVKADRSSGKIKPQQHIVFTEYMLLTNSISDEGKSAPQLYVVVQWLVGAGMLVYVEHEFTAPNQLSGGTEASTVQEATGAIAHLLELEGFSSMLGTIPMSLHLRVTPDQLKPSMFSARNYIDKIMVDTEKVSFIFKHHKTTKETKHKVALQIYPEFKAMLKTKKVKISVRVTDTSIDFFIPHIAAEGQVSTHDVEFLKQRFGLTDQALHKVADIINKGKA